MQVFSENFSGTLDTTTRWEQSGGGSDFSNDTGSLACSVSNNRSIHTRPGMHAALIDCDVDFTRTSAAFDAGITLRDTFGGATSNTGSGYVVDMFSTATIELIARVNGSNRTVGSISSAHTVGTQFKCKIRTVPGVSVTVEIIKDGVSVGTITDTNAARILTAGRCGCYYFTGASRIDNFAVDDLSVAPAITDVDEDNVITSTQTNVEIDGTDFSSATVEIRQGSVEVAQSIDSQSGTAIQFDVVFDSGSTDLKYGPAVLAVTNASTLEDTIDIEIEAPSGRKYVDITTPDPTAANRLTGSPTDLAGGDQVEAFDVEGGTIDDLTLYPDGTFDVAEGVTAFKWRPWDASDSTWGTAATQITGDAIVELVGAAIASAAAAGELTHSVPLAGAASAGAAGSAALTLAVPLQGAALSSAIADGALSLTVSLSGDAFVSALAAAQMAHGVPLAGAAVAGAQAAALLSLEVALSGDAIARVTGSAQLAGEVALAGEATASAQASATLSSSVSLTGSATAGAQAAGTLSFVIALTAQAVANALATGALSVNVNLTGAAIAQALAGGALTVLADVQLQGAAQARAVAAAALSVTGTDIRPITRVDSRPLRARVVTCANRSRAITFRLN